MARWHRLVPALLDFLKEISKQTAWQLIFVHWIHSSHLISLHPWNDDGEFFKTIYIFLPFISLSQGYGPHHRNHRGWLDWGYNEDFSLLTAGLIACIKMNGWWRISKSNYELFSHQPHFLTLYHSPRSPHHKEHTLTHTHTCGLGKRSLALLCVSAWCYVRRPWQTNSSKLILSLCRRAMKLENCWSCMGLSLLNRHLLLVKKWSQLKLYNSNLSKGGHKAFIAILFYVVFHGNLHNAALMNFSHLCFA